MQVSLVIESDTFSSEYLESIVTNWIYVEEETYIVNI